MLQAIRTVTICACLSALLSGCGESPVGTITYDAAFKSEDVAFERMDAPADVGFVYKQVSDRTEMQVKVKGTGEFDYFYDSDETIVNTHVPGINDDGYSRVTLRTEADGRYILVDDETATIESEDGSVTQTPYSVSAEVKFVEGDWQDLTAGKAVKITYTEPGFEEMKRASVQILMDRLVKGIDEGYGMDVNQWRREVVVDTVSLENPVYELDGTSLHYKTTTPQRIVIRMVYYQKK